MGNTNTAINDNMYYQRNPLQLLLCPYCNKNIPNLILQESEGVIDIGVKCSCLPYSETKTNRLKEFINLISQPQSSINQCGNHSYSKGEKYCMNCSLWLCKECIEEHSKLFQFHLISDHQLSVKCIIHKKIFSSYCEQCFVNVCVDCQVNHLAHNMTQMKDVDIILFNMKYLSTIEELMNKNKRITDGLIQRINNKNDNKYNLMKQNILSAYNSNRIINEDLKYLFQCLSTTEFVFKNYPLYQILRLQQKIKINNSKFCEEKEGTIEQNYTKLIQHFKKNFILTSSKTTNECSATFTGHKDCVRSLIQLNDSRLASGSDDQQIRLWDTITNECQGLLIGHTDTTRCLVQLNDGQLASGSYDNTIKIWDLNSNKCKTTLNGHSSLVISLIQLFDGRLASSSSDETIKLWDLKTKKCQMTLRGHSDAVVSLIQIKGSRLVSGSADKTIKIWDINVNECKASLTGHCNTIGCLVQLNDSILASSSFDTTIKLWNLTTLHCITTLAGHIDSVCCLIKLRDGRLASASYDKTIKIWNTQTYKCQTKLSGHDNSVICLIQLFDGRLASSSYDKSIKLWTI